MYSSKRIQQGEGDCGQPESNARKEMSGHRRAAKKNQERPGGEVDGDEVENHRHAR